MRGIKFRVVRGDDGTHSLEAVGPGGASVRLAKMDGAIVDVANSFSQLASAIGRSAAAEILLDFVEEVTGRRPGRVATLEMSGSLLVARDGIYPVNRDGIIRYFAAGGEVEEAKLLIRPPIYTFYVRPPGRDMWFRIIGDEGRSGVYVTVDEEGPPGGQLFSADVMYLGDRLGVTMLTVRVDGELVAAAAVGRSVSPAFAAAPLSRLMDVVGRPPPLAVLLDRSERIHHIIRLGEAIGFSPAVGFVDIRRLVLDAIAGDREASEILTRGDEDVIVFYDDELERIRSIKIPGIRAGVYIPAWQMLFPLFVGRVEFDRGVALLAEIRGAKVVSVHSSSPDDAFVSAGRSWGEAVEGLAEIYDVAAELRSRTGGSRWWIRLDEAYHSIVNAPDDLFEALRDFLDGGAAASLSLTDVAEIQAANE